MIIIAFLEKYKEDYDFVIVNGENSAAGFGITVKIADEFLSWGTDVISGGNIDVLMISSMINKGLIRRDRIFSFSVDISDKPGELAKVVDLIAELGANVVKLEHNQFKNLSRFRDVEVQITVETNGTDHIQNLIETFEKKGYEIIKIKSKIN